MALESKGLYFRLGTVILFIIFFIVLWNYVRAPFFKKMQFDM